MSEEERRQKIINNFAYELPVLRARLGVSQAEIADKIGVSRQTYCGIENGKKHMNWLTYIALYSVFINNSETRDMLKATNNLKEATEQELEI